MHHLPARGAGLVACLNRPTRLYHLPSLKPAAAAAQTTAADDAATTGDAAARAAAAAAPAARARCLTPSLYLAHLPMLSPDGRTLAFYAAAKPFAAHATALELRTMPWPPAAAAGAADADADAEGSVLCFPCTVGRPSPAMGGRASAASTLSTRQGASGGVVTRSSSGRWW